MPGGKALAVDLMKRARAARRVAEDDTGGRGQRLGPPEGGGSWQAPWLTSGGWRARMSQGHAGNWGRWWARHCPTKGGRSSRIASGGGGPQKTYLGL